MRLKDLKSTLLKFPFYFIMAIILLWPFFVSAAESVTLNPTSPGCLGSEAFVNINWASTISGTPTYFVLRKIQGEPDTSYIQITSTSSFSYIDKPVDSDKNYVYKIRAERGGDIFFSNEETALAAYCPQVLSPPTTSCQADGPHINLSWSGVSGNLSTYEIYRDAIKIYSTTSTIYDDGPNIEGTKTYNYFVKAIWQNGNSTTSDEVPVTALACPPTLTLTADCATSSPGGPRINLSWNPLLGVQNYQIYRKAQSEAGFTLLKTSTSTTYADNLVESLSASYWQGGTIYYYVKAIWVTDQKDSDQKQTTIPRCAPFLRVESNCDEFSFRLSWTATMDAAKYNIYRNGIFIKQNLGVTNTSHTDGLDLTICPGQICTFNYQVIAVDSGVNLSSNLVSQSIDCATVVPPSPAPVLNTPQTSCVSGNSRISLSWSSSNNVTYYSLYRVGATTSEFKLVETSYEDSGVQGGYGYTYWVTAYGKGGTSTTSNSQTITAVSCTPPSTPTLTLSTGCATGTPYVNLSWSSTTNTLGYDIYRGLSAAALNLLITFDEYSPEFTTRTWKDTGVSTSTTYYYKVASNGPIGVPSSSSTVQSITTLSCLPTTPNLTWTKACESGIPVVNLFWSSDDANTSRYEVFREDYSTTIPIFWTSNLSIKTWKDNSGLSATTTYKYKVEAVGYGASPQRATQGYKSITTDSCFPTVPNVTLSTDCDLGNARVRVSWTSDNTNTHHYEIFREDVSTSVPRDTVATSGTSYFWIDTAVSQSTPYNYKVEAVGYINTQRTSQGYKPITTYNCALPGPFTLNDPPNIYCQGSYPRSDLSWTSSTNSTSYDLFRNRLNADDSIAETATTSNVVSPYTDFGFGNALSFDGVNDYVNVADPPSLSVQTHTVEFWIKFNSIAAGAWRPVLQKWGAGSDRAPGIWRHTTYPQRLHWRYNPGNLGFSNVGPGGEGTDFNVNEWYHIVGVKEGTTLKLYVNGKYVATAAVPNPITQGAGDFRLGASANAPAVILDEARIYNQDLSSTTVSEHYQGIYPAAETGLVGLWHFDEGPGSSASDSSNFGNNGTLINGPSWVQSGLQSQTKYNWQTKANGHGGSTLSNTTTPATLPLCLPTKPGLVLSTFCEIGTTSIPAVTLRWSYSINTSIYEIYRQDKGLIGTTTQSTIPSLRTFTDNNDGAGLAATTSYTYYIKAIGPTALENQSDLIPITTLDCTPPSRPENLTATPACGGTGNSYPRVNLSWATSTNTTSYTIYRTLPLPVVSFTTALTSYTDAYSSVIVNTNYSYYVVAYGPGGASVPSDTVSTTTGYCTPSTPSILVLTTGCESLAPFNTIAWSDATTFNTTEYRIYRNTSNSPPAAPIITIASTTAEFSSRIWKDNLGLSSLTPYYYWVKAVGPAGESATSSSKSISTYGCGLTPNTPTLNLDNLYCLDNLPYATLSWNTVANAYSYNLYRTNPNLSTSTYSTRLSPLTDKGSSALKFDGSNDYVNIPNSASLNPKVISMEAWVYPTAYNSYANIINKRYPAQYILRFYSTTGRIQGYVYSGGGWRACTTLAAINAPLNAWSQIAATFDGMTGRVYVNGVEGCAFSYTGEISADTAPLRIGAYDATTERFKGTIDEVRIYGRALNATEATEHYNGIYKNEADLRGAWHFDEGSGTNALDNSGNGNNGTMVNMDPAVSWVQPTGEPNIVLPLENEKNYSYRVKAFGVDTASEFSNPIATTTPSCLPATPTLAVIPQCEAGNSQLKLSWQSDPNTLSWTIHKKREGDIWDRFPFPITTTNLFYLDGDVESGVNYEYYVVAVGVGVSTISDIITKTAPYCYDPPYGGTAFSISATSVCYGYSVRNKAEWPTDPTGKTLSYNIWRKNITLGETDFSTISVGLGPTALSYLDIGVSENDKYFYKVEAVGSGEGNTLFSNTSTEVTALECSTLPPNPPTLSLDSIESTADLRAVYMYWTDAGNEDYYAILRASSFGPFAEIATTSGYVTPTTVYWVDSSWDRVVNDGQAYSYKIIAYNINGGTESNEIIADVPIARPGAFTLTGSKVGAVIHLTWTEAATTTAGGAATYKILRSNNSAFGSPAVICENIMSPPFECYDNNPSFYEEYYKAVATNLGGSTYTIPIRIMSSPPVWKEIIPW